MSLLTITDLSVNVTDKQVIDGVSANISRGQIVLLTGPNGSGKSSLANTLLGNSFWQVTGGAIAFDGRDLLSMTPDERARSGLYVAWQSPVAIPGISVFTLCKAAYEAVGNKIDSVVAFKKQLDVFAERVGLTKEHIGRSVNEGFSGGERKRLELLQMLLLQPKLVVLDEIDSGLDEVGRAMVVAIIQELQKQGTAAIVISHYKDLLRSMRVDARWEMKHGRLHARI